ncbi:hypothetical protein Gohar_026483 [Gossypium harknessii]|uniref:Uncharacterized protein n=2 Tax=Gossypium TaxID=3633 RepID=A0A7J9HRQ1_9ROSI|nr:hypothetical protein [Gossypium harknessii]
MEKRRKYKEEIMIKINLIRKTNKNIQKKRRKR